MTPLDFYNNGKVSALCHLYIYFNNKVNKRQRHPSSKIWQDGIYNSKQCRCGSVTRRQALWKKVFLVHMKLRKVKLDEVWLWKQSKWSKLKRGRHNVMRSVSLLWAAAGKQTEMGNISSITSLKRIPIDVLFSWAARAARSPEYTVYSSPHFKSNVPRASLQISTSTPTLMRANDSSYCFITGL